MPRNSSGQWFTVDAEQSSADEWTCVLRLFNVDPEDAPEIGAERESFRYRVKATSRGQAVSECERRAENYFSRGDPLDP